MSVGIIFQHFWQDQNHSDERKALEQSIDLIYQLPKHVPTLSMHNTQEQILDQLKTMSALTVDHTPITDGDGCKQVLRNWIQKNDINVIYIAGLHFEHCVMAVCDLLKQICNESNKDWENNFRVRVIRQCTAFVENESFWFIDKQQAIEQAVLDINEF